MAEALGTREFIRPHLREEVVATVLEHEEHWHYEGGRRDLRLDLLRGFAAAAMIADHIGGEQSWLYPLTGGNRFFASAAEAFVFISGAVMGIVYLNVVTKQGLAAGLTKSLQRAATLYLVTVVLTLTFAGLSQLADLPWAPVTNGDSAARYVLDIITLHRTLYLVDIPLMYVLLLLASGPVIFLLSQGRAPVVLVASWALWLLWQISPDSSSVPWEVQGNEVFNFPAWQALFVTGIVLGWHRAGIEAWAAKLSRRFIAGAVLASVVAVVALYVLQVAFLDALDSDTATNSWAFDKANLPIGRLAVFFLLFAFAFSMTTLFWQPIRRASGWLLLPLGQNALTAYSVHIFLVAGSFKLTEEVFDGDPGPAINGAIQLAALLLVWAFIRLEPVVKNAALSRTRALPPFRYRGNLAGAGQ